MSSQCPESQEEANYYENAEQAYNEEQEALQNASALAGLEANEYNKKVNEVKTLKDISQKRDLNKYNDFVTINDLKVKAIKWIKEDLEMLIPSGEKGEYQQIVKDILINRWIKRFNLTDGDFK